VLSLAVVVAVMASAFALRDHLRQFSQLGYPGIFLISLLTSATIILPLPGVAVVFAAGSFLNPWGLALAAGTGAAIGEMTGFLAGYSGQSVIERADLYARIAPWVVRLGDPRSCHRPEPFL
jgi:membrane protein YqaA with SNARE-associated domain